MSDQHDPAGHDDLHEQTLSSEFVYDGRVVNLYLDTVRLPNGKTARRELIRHPGAVAIVPVDAEGSVILVRQFRYAAGRVLWEVPAGTLEPDEDPNVCAHRELQEEIGHKAGKLERLGGIFVAPGYTSEFIHLYLATDLSESRLEGDSDEFIQVERFSWREVLRKIRSGEIEDGKSISSLFLARDYLTRDRD
ncbi:MAG: NUDIX hydrolase [Anaerolinea sp.]|nr:NUDIX hydrolase [Anaerolinea sp.]MCC6973586.1 NUDIX hydrolase [Anaerolineae bacterium]CAG1013899.1 ADP-ribose pyrophosphatase [Anaerolineae bacterium]